MSCQILSERIDGALLLILSDPATGNRLTAQACAAAIEALDSAETDPQVSSVVVTGQGGRFCSGMADAPESLDLLVETLHALAKPVIAAVDGEAAGAGCALALACDFIVAGADAHFSQPIEASLSTTWQRPLRALPRALAMQLLCGTPALSATDARACGMVNVVAAAGTARAQALDLAAQLARLPPGVAARAKQRLGYDAP